MNAPCAPLDSLVEELKAKVIQVLGLPLRPDKVDPDQPLLGTGLGIDSIDTLELVVMIEKDYGVRIENRTEGTEAFGSLRTLAAFIQARQAEKAAASPPRG